MKLLVSLILIVTVAYFSSRIFFSLKRIPLGLRFISMTGIEFILLGYLLGSGGIGLLDASVLAGLEPAIGLGLAWIGLVFGLQFNWKNLRRLPPTIFLQSMGQAAIVLAVVFIAILALQGKVPGVPGRLTIPSIIVMASAASLSSPTLIPLLMEYAGAHGRTTRLLEQISSMDAVPGVLMLGVATALWRAAGPVSLLEGILFFLLSIVVGVLLACVFKVLASERLSDGELLLLTLAMVVFSGGIALYLTLSPIFVNFVLGVVLANIHWSNFRIFKVLAIPEKPIYFMFLILSGAILDLDHLVVFQVALILLLVRLAAKVLANHVLVRTLYPRRKVPWSLGLGIIPQGGIAIAIAIDFHRSFGAGYAGLIASMIIVAIVANDLIGPPLARSVLKTAGDIS